MYRPSCFEYSMNSIILSNIVDFIIEDSSANHYFKIGTPVIFDLDVKDEYRGEKLFVLWISCLQHTQGQQLLEIIDIFYTADDLSLDIRVRPKGIISRDTQTHKLERRLNELCVPKILADIKKLNAAQC